MAYEKHNVKVGDLIYAKTINDIDDQTALNEENITSLNEDVTDLSGQVNTLSGNVNNVSSRVSGMSTTVSNLSSQMTSLSSSHGSLTTKVNGISSTVTSLSNTVDTLSSNEQTTAGKVMALEGEVDTLSDNVDTVSGKVTGLTTDVTTLKTDTGTLKTDVSTLKTNVSTLQTAAGLETVLASKSTLATGKIISNNVKVNDNWLSNLTANSGAIYTEAAIDVSEYINNKIVIKIGLNDAHSGTRVCGFCDSNNVITEMHEEKNLEYYDAGTYLFTELTVTNTHFFFSCSSKSSLEIVGKILSKSVHNITKVVDSISERLPRYQILATKDTLGKNYYIKDTLAVGENWSENKVVNTGSIYTSAAINVRSFAGEKLVIKIGGKDAHTGVRTCGFCGADNIATSVYQEKTLTYYAEDGFLVAELPITDQFFFFSCSSKNYLTIYVKDPGTIIDKDVAYVATTGNDTDNNGSSVYPYATVNKAIQSGAKKVFIKAGTYSQTVNLDLLKGRQLDLINVTPTQKVIFKAPNCAIVTSETLVSGKTKTYQATVSTTFGDKNIWLFQEGVADASTKINAEDILPEQRGYTYRCADTKIEKCTATTESAAIAEIESSTEYKWFQNGTTLYFSRPQAVSSANPICASTGYTFFNHKPTRCTINMTGIDIKYMSLNLNDTSLSRITDCSVSNVFGAGAYTFDGATGLEFINCEAARAFYGTNGDGFNAHSITSSGDAFAYQTTASLTDCWSHDNRDDGVSTHERSELFVNGGLYEYNAMGGGVTPASDAHCSCIGVVARKNGEGGFLYMGGTNGQFKCVSCLSDSNNTWADVNSAGYKLLDANTATLINCKAMNEDYAFYADNANGKMYLIDSYAVNCNREKGGQTKAIIEVDSAASKAENDGYYEDMTVGDAEQLVSSQYVEDSEPYLYSTTGGSADVGNREYVDAIVGGSVVWNQLLKLADTSYAKRRVTTSYTGHSVTLTSTTDSLDAKGIQVRSNLIITGHVYYIHCDFGESGIEGCSLGMYSVAGNAGIETCGSSKGRIGSIIIKYVDTGWLGFRIPNATAAEASFTFSDMQLIDLTTMFGSTIANAIYTMEQTTAGAGVAWFRNYFPLDYCDYCAGEMRHVSGLQSHDTVGFNLFDKSLAKQGYRYNTTGSIPVTNANQKVAASALIRVFPNTSYYFKNICGNDFVTAVYWYDNDGNYISSHAVSGVSPTSGMFTSPVNAAYVGVNLLNEAIDATCINLSWSGWRNGEYEPYVKHSYPLDNALTLRGIPKLDSEWKLYFDGDEYLPDGTVNRRYGIVDLGTLNWAYMGAPEKGFYTEAIFKYSSNIMCINYVQCDGSEIFAGTASDKTIGLSSNGRLRIKDTAYSDVTNFKTAMSGVYLLYELTTPTTETAEPYHNIQLCDDFGTEEFVSTGIVPVGHRTRYPANLRDKLQHLPNLADNDGYYVVQQTNKQMSLVQFRIPQAPTTSDGLYVLKAVVDNGEPTYFWEQLEAVEPGM